MVQILERPLEEETRLSKIADPCIMVIFGATGDLTARKLVPALYNLARDGELPSHFACVGFARRDKTHEQFRQEMRAAVEEHSRILPIDETIWHTFSEQLFYHRSEFDRDGGYESLGHFLNDLDGEFHTKGNRLYYFSTQPSFFSLISEKLSAHNLLYPINDSKWSRIIVEKPFGHDLQSAELLQSELTRHLSEQQIYRIDHYLGKETVQNLLVLRFGNSIFESLWNNRHIDSVQITVSEEMGIGTRGHFFEEAGLLRDIVQNHMMQLLSLVAMEPPTHVTAKGIHDEKVKVLEAIRPLPEKDLQKYAVRGQYGKGFVQGNEVLGYRQEENVLPSSNVETFVAMRLFIDNWRWSGVPFYLRAGKRLPKRATEIAITFKESPGVLFQLSNRNLEQNVLVIRIQPDEGVSLKINCKVPGLGSPIEPVKMDFRYGAYFGLTPPEAYERLICDCIAGDSTLFARVDEVLASWRLLDPVIQAWEKTSPKEFPKYEAGTWGPAAANELLAQDGHQWRLI